MFTTREAAGLAELAAHDNRTGGGHAAACHIGTDSITEHEVKMVDERAADPRPDGGLSTSIGGAPASPPGPPDVCTVMIYSLRPADSPRLSGVNEDHIRLLAETDAVLPPILVHRNTMRVIDGMHRLRAAIRKGQRRVEVEFFDGSDDDAFMRAVAANIAYGLPLSLADRRAAAARIVIAYPRLSDRVIAFRTGLAAKTVSAIRRGSIADVPQLNARIGADGRLRPLHGSAGRRRAFEVIAERPGASLREIARAAGVSVGTAHDVRTRVLRGEEPVGIQHRGAGQRGGSPAAEPGDGSPGSTPPSAGLLTSRAAARDGRSILQNLMRDPSIRHTDLGRELLRWLRATAIAADDWSQLVNAVPPHCTDLVAELARQCAQTWAQFAQELKRRKYSAT